jgi:hypothetical protein
MSAPGPLVYAQCGLRLRSELPLALPELPAGRWDVDVRWGPDLGTAEANRPARVIASDGDGDAAWYTASSTGDGHLLRFRDCGEFVISAGLDEVAVRPQRSGRFDLLPILLAGTVSAFLLAMRGTTVLHASAVAIDGTVLAFIGQSGRGKSTLAALLCAHGATLVADDLLALEPGPPVTCTGGASHVRLRRGAASIAHAQPDADVRTTADERIALAIRHAGAEPHALAGIVLPAPSRTAAAVEVQRLGATNALVALLSFPRVQGWREADVLRRDFSVLSRVADEIPVHRVVIPWGPPFPPSVATELSLLVAPAARLRDGGA